MKNVFAYYYEREEEMKPSVYSHSPSFVHANIGFHKRDRTRFKDKALIISVPFLFVL